MTGLALELGEGGAPPAGGEAPAPARDGAPVLSVLRQHADRGVTGELLLRGAGGDVRVYLQRGRVAWASDARRRRRFTERLKALAGLDDDAIEAVVRACQRSRQPIGEALVSRRLATEEQVRTALRDQIAAALAQASAEARPRASFAARAQYASYDARFTFPLAEILSADGAVLAPAGPSAAAAREPTSGRDAVPGEPHRKETQSMTPMDKLKELQTIEGFSGAALFTPTGEPLVLLDGDVQRLKDVGVLANTVLLNAQKTSLEMGTGRGQMVHVEGEKAHVLVRCMNEGTDPLKSQPGKAHIHLVVVLKSEGALGLAKMRMGAAVQKLAEDFRI